ncbi:MAG: D-glycero-beta-D-manno-heptose-7-phosphate kinase [Planctomycetes bacterium]|nr:D-glycero-beta-D-manno-heptose-7-phosphate kinase [Planctomycetota bacterium]
MITRQTELLRAFGRPRILVAGDLLLDRYLWGKVERISPEGPIPILHVQREEERPGGAANVATNLVALGARAACAGAVGDDAAGKQLLAVMKAAGIDTSAVVTDASKPTPIKTRCIAQSQQMLRVDREKTSALAPKSERELIKRIDKQVAKCDLVVISDYNKGVLTDAVLSAVMKAGKKRGKPVIVGPKGDSYGKYWGCTAVAPNLKELRIATGMPAGTDDEIRQAAESLLSELGCEFVLVTRGDKGMSLFRPGGKPLHVAARPRQVYDVAGAGDTSVATLGLALACGASPEDAVRLANTAGGIAVTKVGVATVTRQEIMEDLGEEHELRTAKIRTVEELQARMKEHRDRQQTVAFTNGCFDVLHVGHLRTLRFARAQGDVLVVGINSDASVKTLKGPDRPIVGENERAQVLAALEDVDYVVIFGEKTPVDLLKKLKPDVLVKGGDYKPDEVVGAEVVKGWGGRVAVAPLAEGVSTTNMVKKIRKKN